MSIEDNISEAIRANLPAQVGDVLKKRLDQAEKDAQELEQLKSRLNLVTDQRDSITKDREALSVRVSVYESREAELVKREKEIQKLELTAQFEKQKADLVQNMFGVVFQNRTVRESSLVQRDYQSWTAGCQGPNIYQNQLPESRTVTES